MRQLRTSLLLLVILCASAWAAIEDSFPVLTGPVVDAASILDANARSKISDDLLDYQSRSGHQIVVATVPSLENHDIRDYGNRLFRHWALGNKERDDGVLLLVAPNERKVSIEVGYGIEPDLTDALSRVIIENAVTPRFRAGDYAGGISAAIDDIAKALSGSGNDIVERARNQSAPGLDDVLPIIFLFIVVLVIIANASRGGGVIIVPGPGGYGGRWSGGGWPGGGQGGGYGGGGGSSGGGGASGSW
jgi:uncharacterized protein